MFVCIEITFGTLYKLMCIVEIKGLLLAHNYSWHGTARRSRLRHAVWSDYQLSRDSINQPGGLKRLV